MDALNMRPPAFIRTPSGMPMCAECQQPAGTCDHTGISRSLSHVEHLMQHTHSRSFSHSMPPSSPSQMDHTSTDLHTATAAPVSADSAVFAIPMAPLRRARTEVPAEKDDADLPATVFGTASTVLSSSVSMESDTATISSPSARSDASSGTDMRAPAPKRPRRSPSNGGAASEVDDQIQGTVPVSLGTSSVRKRGAGSSAEQAGPSSPVQGKRRRATSGVIAAKLGSRSTAVAAQPSTQQQQQQQQTQEALYSDMAVAAFRFLKQKEKQSVARSRGSTVTTGRAKRTRATADSAEAAAVTATPHSDVVHGDQPVLSKRRTRSGAKVLVINASSESSTPLAAVRIHISPNHALNHTPSQSDHQLPDSPPKHKQRRSASSVSIRLAPASDRASTAGSTSARTSPTNISTPTAASSSAAATARSSESPSLRRIRSDPGPQSASGMKPSISTGGLSSMAASAAASGVTAPPSPSPVLSRSSSPVARSTVALGGFAAALRADSAANRARGGALLHNAVSILASVSSALQVAARTAQQQQQQQQNSPSDPTLTRAGSGSSTAGTIQLPVGSTAVQHWDTPLFVWCEGCANIQPCKVKLCCATCLSDVGFHVAPDQSVTAPTTWRECIGSRISGVCDSCLANTPSDASISHLASQPESLPSPSAVGPPLSQRSRSLTNVAPVVISIVDVSSQSQAQALWLPVCTTCHSLGVPLLNVRHNEGPTASTCIGCWTAEPLVIDFDCNRAQRAGDSTNANAGAVALSSEPSGAGGKREVQTGVTSLSTMPVLERSDSNSSASGLTRANSDVMPGPHVQCRECFENFARSAITERNLCLDQASATYTLACPMGCPSSCVDPQMFRILGEAMFKKYRRFVALNYADDQNIQWCPLETCKKGFLPPDRHAKDLLCTACNRHHCRLCKRASHSGPCPDVSSDDLAAVSEDERKSLELIRNSTKPCPKCSVRIFKDQGCNHMTCAHCDYQFCWLHGTEWTDGGACQEGHWFDSAVATHAANVGRRARTSLSSCVVM